MYQAAMVCKPTTAEEGGHHFHGIMMHISLREVGGDNHIHYVSGYMGAQE